MPGRQRPKPRLTKKGKKAQILALVNAAKLATNLLDDLKEWTTYNKHDMNLKVSFSNAKDLKTEEVNQIFDLLQKNMKDLYDKSDWGWNADEKMSELTSDEARFLVVKDSEDKLVGFTHFQFDVETNYPVLYCYELQIESDYQRKGLGRFLMNILTLIAFKFKLVKVMLTVFTNNRAGINFYLKALQFRRDETSPYEEEERCYIILCKFVDKNEVSNIKSI
ncbi:N-alpha-acetyltransferase 40 [Parasteatoda tepidariorum]|uniref:N-alpha-acetyltransferase 40 n=1 Tax=Parasteatoda tepidariorum TaxID=114398 RepID=UPI00077F85A4|nr:N-alpha-acetyltransferase 40 [Parasteatoda tepidariorum]